MPKMRGDFRHGGPNKYQIRHAEKHRLMQEARQRRASWRYCGENLSRPDWLAGDAVQIVPCSARFPCNREFYREFCKIAASGAPETVNNAAVTGLLGRIPYSTEQGIILVEQGIPTREQGISPAKIENITG
jgi:hypothetical protein